MINFAVQAILIAVFLLVFYQDTKDRMVYWSLYPICGILCFVIQAGHIGFQPALVNSLVNLGFITIILFSAYIYSIAVMKRPFVNGSMGIGDVLLFLSLAFTFTTITFVILFVFSLCFSLLLHLYLKNKSPHTNVPLAGHISLFFSVVYMASFFLEPKYLFA
jgi:hypothetical protein